MTEFAALTYEQAQALWQDFLSRRQLDPALGQNGAQGRPPVLTDSRRLVELTEVLYACEDPYSDPLPTAIAKFIVPSTGGGRELSDISIEVSNIGNVAFDEGTIGYVIFTCGFQQFVPLDCPDPSSSSTGGL
jgi:hypothetical protein